MQLSSQTVALSPRPASYKWQVLSCVLFGFFMVLLDTTVINVAFQTLRQEFGGSVTDSQWIISVYVMAMGIVMPMAGFLAERYGSKRIYLLALVMFALGSLTCGLSTSLPMLIVCRLFQGIGGGMAMPLGVTLLLQAFPLEEQGTALGIYGIAALLAPALGPVLGGWLVGLGLWRVIFFINPPIGLIGFIMGVLVLQEKKVPERSSFDVPGIITEIIGFGAILYAASIAAEAGWMAPVTLFWFGVGVVGLVAFTLIELFTAKEPLLDLRLFKDRTFLNANLLGYVSVLALFGAEFLLPIYLQSLRGRSPLETGMILLPMAVTSGILVIISGRIYDRIGPRPLMIVGFSILVVNTWQLSQLKADTPISWIIFLLVLRGISLGLTVQTTMVSALSVVPPKDLPRGTSLNNSLRQVVQSIGVAVLATVLASTLSPDVQTFQNAMTESTQTQTTALCAASPDGYISAARDFSKTVDASATAPTPELLQRACDQNVAGFERSYKVTFYAALAALFLGCLLPGWPQKWVGRRESGNVD
jgi:EmrB/QacA subfamily drug resistance transporter